jgi:multiple sugar transport system ATP-binding protein
VFVHLLIGEKSFVGRFDPRTGVKIGDTVDVVLNVDNMHAFDPQTEEAIR